MTALSWAEQHPDTSESFSKAELGPFLLFACDESWRIRIALGQVAGLDAAHGPASDVRAAKLAAEAWLRAYLHDLQRQLRDPNVGSDPAPMPSNMVALRQGTREVQGIVPFILAVSSERRAPVQGTYKHQGGRRPGTISWEEHLEAWRGYHERHPDQDAERIAERGGFGYEELVMFLGREPTTWRPLR